MPLVNGSCAIPPEEQQTLDTKVEPIPTSPLPLSHTHGTDPRFSRFSLQRVLHLRPMTPADQLATRDQQRDAKGLKPYLLPS